ncbi:hypothetical protein KS4_36500 [Poriferisphaera corsica]|uniref:Uncharacterized protein n=1 Tax=Poriferisphaera corsica TaxID=2528020 RepID=A0A517YZB8_9BACT|nr:hypothetical protein [Poriferisphaera corsica]QDU35567.1 hypothetical protein KS4_36500 [Poriferisphaera corsica]
MVQVRGSLKGLSEENLRINMVSHSEELLDRSTHLPTADRVLLEQVLRYGFTAHEIGRLSGITSSSVLRRVRKLSGRLRDPMYRFVTEKEVLIPRDLKVTARLIFVEGRSMRVASEKQGVTMHHTRKRVQQLRMLKEAHEQMNGLGETLKRERTRGRSRKRS